MPDEIDLSPEDEEILDSVWSKLQEEAELEDQGIGPPRWTVDRARYEQPTLTSSELAEWVSVANDEYRQLRMSKVVGSEADRLSLEKANLRYPNKHSK